jgi:predicted dehydrogenase
VAGAGSLGFHHVRLLHELAGAQFVGVYERNQERAEQVARELGVPCLDSLEALVASCDAVSVAVPTSLHFEVASAVLRAGRHCFIEKPITTTVDEADALLALAAPQGLVVQVGHGERFNRAIRAAQPYVHQPRYIETERSAPFTPRGADVSVVLDLMIHDINLVTAFFGEPVVRVDAIGGMYLRPTPDVAQARLTFGSGAVANLHANRLGRARRRRMRIYQPEGYLTLDLAAGTGEYLRLNRAVDVATLATAPLATDAFTDRIMLEAPEGEPLRMQFEGFLAAIRGGASPLVDGRAGRDALAVALEIDAAIRRGAAGGNGGAGA